MKFDLKKTMLVTSVSLLMSACTTTPESNLNLLPSQPMLAVNLMPSQSQLDGKPLNVLSVSIKPQMHDKYKLSELLPGTLDKAIVEGGANTVDRSLAAKLIEEIEFSEESDSNDFYQGPKVTDLVLAAKIVNYTHNSKFDEQEVYEDKKGKKHVRPAQCTHRTSVEGFIRVLTLPNMNLVETIPFSGYETSLTDTRDSSCPISEANKASLLAKALDDGFAGGETKIRIKSAVAARAFILEKKLDGDNVFFKTTLRKGLGAQEGQEVRVFVEDEASGELQFVADGVITAQEYITRQYSYIYLKDKKTIPLVKKGMIVKIFDTCGFGCKATEFRKGIDSLM
ncbi:hypothetical protein ACMZOO_16190 [Catenovulum sp. SX2]|uniref:hypothetical protein n=1 Tax=Catenovulum sp. SX2 TaxID=3398614 RepID=UPI003F840D1F